MIWFMHQYPELEHLTDDQRWQIAWKFFPNAYVLIILRATVLAGASLFFAGMGWIVLFRDLLPLPILIVVPAVTAVTVYLTEIQRIRQQIRRSVADAFIGEKLPFCLGCGYDLHRSTSDRCPECGESVKGPFEQV